jgi:predicted GH43/DUF377 family glycosyl hydrolase
MHCFHRLQQVSAGTQKRKQAKIQKNNPEEKTMIIKRSKANPLLEPNLEQSWEAQAVFNGCTVKKGNKIHMLYRALSLPHYHTLAGVKIEVSEIGAAESTDGCNFTERRRLILPEHSWEKFGCEDPRVTKLGKKYYIFYTALSTYPFTAEGIKTGLAISKDLKTIDEKHLVTPFNSKAMALFPEKINGKIWAIISVNTDKPPSKICLASFSKEKDIWSQSKWKRWYVNLKKHCLPLKRNENDQIEVGAPPIKTKHGWLLIYSYIKNYFSPQRLFTMEAVLLDLKNPLKIIARSDMPLLTPEAYYERFGMVPNVIFPSGALINKDWLDVYYGAADTTCCLVSFKMQSLLDHILKKEKKSRLKRPRKTPLLEPVKNHFWESKATFNPGAICIDGKIHLLYRAMSEDNTSVLGYASSKDGIHIDYRSKEPVYVPREPFEQKLVPGGNSGCEDPRLTRIGNKIYMIYTVFDGKHPPRIALTSITVKDFLNKKWNWAKPVPLSPPALDDKDAFVFPEKVKGKYIIVHRSGDDMDLAFEPTLDFKGDTWLEEYRWLAPRKGWWDSKKVGATAPPIKTKKGWLLLYHGVSDDNCYRIGAALLDLKNPVKIIGRTDYPIFEPETQYEKQGEVSNVVFPCGMAEIEGTLFVYYGGADKVTGVATIKTKKLLDVFESYKY